MIIVGMAARWWSLGGWALVAASAVYWGFKLFVAPLPVPVNATVATVATPAHGDLTRLFGAETVVTAVAEPQADTRFELVGVLAPRSPGAGREGLALIAVDGQPPRTFRVGAVVEGELVLRSVSQHGAALGPPQGETTVALDIPPPAPAATGVPGMTGAADRPVAVPTPRLPGFRPAIRLPGQPPVPNLMRAPAAPGVNVPAPQREVEAQSEEQVNE